MHRGGRHIFQFDSLLMVLVVIFVGGLIGVKMLSSAVYAVESQKGATEAALIHDVYAQHVREQKDVDKLARVGGALLTRKQYFYAALNLEQASDLDTNYRDVAYGWAYALVQANHDQLTTEHVTDIKTALGRAEKVDPFYEPMLRLKLLIAQIENDDTVATATQSRMATLGIQ